MNGIQLGLLNVLILTVGHEYSLLKTQEDCWFYEVQ